MESGDGGNVDGSLTLCRNRFTRVDGYSIITMGRLLDGHLWIFTSVFFHFSHFDIDTH